MNVYSRAVNIHFVECKRDSKISLDTPVHTNNQRHNNVKSGYYIMELGCLLAYEDVLLKQKKRRTAPSHGQPVVALNQDQ